MKLESETLAGGSPEPQSTTPLNGEILARVAEQGAPSAKITLVGGTEPLGSPVRESGDLGEETGERSDSAR